MIPCAMSGTGWGSRSSMPRSRSGRAPAWVILTGVSSVRVGHINRCELSACSCSGAARLLHACCAAARLLRCCTLDKEGLLLCIASPQLYTSYDCAQENAPCEFDVKLDLDSPDRAMQAAEHSSIHSNGRLGGHMVTKPLLLAQGSWLWVNESSGRDPSTAASGKAIDEIVCGSEH